MLEIGADRLRAYARQGVAVLDGPRNGQILLAADKCCMSIGSGLSWTLQAQEVWDWAFPSRVAEAVRAEAGPFSLHHVGQAASFLAEVIQQDAADQECLEQRTLLAFRLLAPLFAEPLQLVDMGVGGWRQRLSDWAAQASRGGSVAALQESAVALTYLFGTRAHPDRPGLGGGLFPPSAVANDLAAKGRLAAPGAAFWEGLADAAARWSFSPVPRRSGFICTEPSPLVLDAAAALLFSDWQPRQGLTPAGALAAQATAEGSFAEALDLVRSSPPVHAPHRAWVLAGQIGLAMALLDKAEGRATLPDLGRIVRVGPPDPLWMREGQNLEFKAAYEFDPRTGRRNGALRLGVLRSVCAFLNSGGGEVIVGIADDGAATGIAGDLLLTEDENPLDALELRVREHIAKALDPRPVGLIDLAFLPTPQGLLMSLKCSPSPVVVELCWKDESTGMPRRQPYWRDGARTISARPPGLDSAAGER